MNQFVYLGFDRQLADSLESIGFSAELQHHDVPADFIDRLALINSLPFFPESVAPLLASPTIVYAGRFEKGSTPADRTPLRTLADDIAGSSDATPGVAVLTAWLLIPGLEAKRFQRMVPGSLRWDAACTGDSHWSDLIWPDGFRTRLSQIAPTSRMVSKVTRLAYDIMENAEGAVSHHLYELHLTIACNDKSEFDILRDTCGDLGIKCIEIILGTGNFQKHTITGSFHRGSLTSVLEEAHALSNLLSKRGFDVTRVKLESTLENPIVPTDASSASRMSSEQYFECHAKIVVPQSGPDLVLRELCERHGAHLSKNPSNVLADGKYCVFLTQRFFKMMKSQATGAFDALLADLRAHSFVISNVMHEYALIDSNIGLDEEWIPHEVIHHLLEANR